MMDSAPPLGQRRDGLVVALAFRAAFADSSLARRFATSWSSRQVLAGNPASAVRAPKVIRRVGSTPVLVGDEARQLLDIDT